MRNQANFNKVHNNFIAPLGKIFNKSPHEDLVEAFVEDLGGYSEKTLQEAAIICRRNCKFFPNIAQAIEACEKTKPQEGSLRAAPKMDCAFNTGLADQVMKSKIGQLALSQGVGQSVWMLAFRDNRNDLTEADVYRIRDKWQEGVAMLADPSKIDKTLYAPLEKLYRTISDKERELAVKYLPRLERAA